MCIESSHFSGILYASLQASANKLINRLKDPEIQSAIDESAKCRSRTGVSWDAIMNAIFEYVITEAKELENHSKLRDDTFSRKKKVFLYQKYMFSFFGVINKFYPLLFMPNALG